MDYYSNGSLLTNIIHIWMWVKQCHKPPMTGNGNHTTYKHGDDWEMVYKIAMPTLCHMCFWNGLWNQSFFLGVFIQPLIHLWWDSAKYRNTIEKLVWKPIQHLKDTSTNYPYVGPSGKFTIPNHSWRMAAWPNITKTTKPILYIIGQKIHYISKNPLCPLNPLSKIHYISKIGWLRRLEIFTTRPSRAAPVPRNPNRYLGRLQTFGCGMMQKGELTIIFSMQIWELQSFNHELELVPFNIAKLRINLETSSFI